MRRLQSGLAGVRFRYAIYPFPREVGREVTAGKDPPDGPLFLPRRYRQPSTSAPFGAAPRM